MKNLTHKPIYYALLCLALFSSTAYSHSPLGRKYGNPVNPVVERRFKSWLEQHNKHYKDKDEYMLRFGIYQANLDFIEFFNAKNLSYQLGDNEFADLTNEEFKELYVGRLKFAPVNHTTNETVSCSGSPKAPPPAALDWRTKGALNPIKNQGQCGSCWAFSSVASIEAATQIKTKRLISLSEQQLVDCVTGASKGCEGGSMEEAFQYVQKNGGIASEQEYPYKGTQGSCQGAGKKTATITGYKTIPKNNEAAVMAAVALQPISAALDAEGSPFQLYKGGIFKGDCGTELNHAVNLVGYGEEAGGKFWIMRNSWGASWGEKGYMRLARGAQGAGTCGINMTPSYPLA